MKEKIKCVAKSRATKKCWMDPLYRKRHAKAIHDYHKVKRSVFIKEHGVIAWNKRFSRNIKMQVIEAYGGECKCCGESTYEFLTIDHTSKKTRLMHRNVSGKGHRLYKWLIKNNFPRAGIRLLCMNCNLATAWGRTCPHQSKMQVRHVRPRQGRFV